MPPLYLGVDIAGASNTWATLLGPTPSGLRIIEQPALHALTDIVDYCDRHDVIAIAIDAQLSIALSDENGFRSCDRELRSLLPSNCLNWVASVNSLMAVPVRGRMLADALAPRVGTIIETHPRASLLFALGDERLESIRSYKTGEAKAEAVAHLWHHWRERYGILDDIATLNDGAIDAVVCATVAYLYHHEPASLHRLRHDAADRSGRGPFYVVNFQRTVHD